jgi:hypothetical protein
MKWILIDTNGWVSFLESQLDKEVFNDLLDSIDSGEWQLLVPEVLLKEWRINRDRKLQAIRKAHIDTLGNLMKSNALLNSYIEMGYAELEKTAQKINELLEKGEQVAISDDVVNIVGRLFLTGKAPFHTGRKNHMDAYLFYAAIERIRSKGWSEVIFVSNDADFRENREAKGLHPDLTPADIRVNFYRDVSTALRTNNRKKEGDVAAIRSAEYVPYYLIGGSEVNRPMIERLLEVKKYAEAQQPFVPTNLLSRVVPFKNFPAEKDYTYDYSFGISSNNNELLEYLREWNTKKEKNELTQEETNKLEDVYQWLNQNTIFELTGINYEYTVSVHSSEATRQLDAERNVFLLRWMNALEMLDDDANIDDPCQILQRAYYHAYFGNFSKAARLYAKLFDAIEDKQWNILSFICIYNLKQLRHLSAAYHTSIPENVQLIFNRFEKKRLDEYVLTYSVANAFDRDCIRFLQEKLFFTEASAAIVEEVEKIRDQYHSQLKGGWSSNSFVRNLLSEFARLESYLDRNRIVYKNYSEFGKLFDRFLEGMLMSYAMNERQDSRLREFDDYLLLRIVYYADTDHLFKYLKRYGIRELKYRPGNDTEERASTIMLNFWKQIPDFIEAMEEKLEHNGIYFFSRFDHVLSNSLTLLALVNFEPAVYNEFGDQLVKVVSIANLKRLKPIYIANVIRDKGVHFTNDCLQKLLLLFLNTPTYHDASLFQAVRKLEEKHEVVIDRPDSAIALFMEQERHPDILAECFNLLDDTGKQEVTQRLESEMEKEFDAERYYLYSIFELIDYRKFFTHYKASFPPRQAPLSIRHVFSNSELTYHDFNNFLNLCFKYSIDTTTEEFSQWKGFSPYYDWLLDMDHFDYSMFNVDWVLQYKTLHYLVKIFGNKKVCAYIQHFMQNHHHPYIAYLFTKYAKRSLR